MQNQIIEAQNMNGIGLLIGGLYQSLWIVTEGANPSKLLTALIKMLPRLQASDADLLTPRQYQQLLWLLKNAEGRFRTLNKCNNPQWR